MIDFVKRNVCVIYIYIYILTDVAEIIVHLCQETNVIFDRPFRDTEYRRSCYTDVKL